jgi:outer membrane protein assembly factor BamB
VESIPNAFGGHGIYSTPAYWQGNLYFWAPADGLRIFQMVNGLVSPTPIAIGSTVLSSPGATPVISSNGASNGIVWAIQSGGHGAGLPAVLHALDAHTAAELYNSGQAGTRDVAGPAIKFTPPTVANGKVYVPTASELDVYGLLP